MRKMGAEAVVLNMKTETYYMLNTTGIRMWEVLTTASSVDEALATLTTEYAIPNETLNNDMNEFIQNLQSAKLIEITP
jgi:hypothetical protein